LCKHPVGVHFQNIPVDDISQLSAIPYNQISDYGYYKIDMLHLSVLDMFDNKQQIKAILKKKPNWDLLSIKENVQKLFQLSKHCDLVKILKPRSIMDIADCIALIRPGKMDLLAKYMKDKESTRILLYSKTSSSDYKKSHAVAYAHIVVLQLHLIESGII
jgi:DNA polymerase III alpha subunit